MNITCSPGDPSWFGVRKRAARGRPHPGSERHRPAPRDAPGGRAGAAGQQAGDSDAGAQRSLTARDAGQSRRELGTTGALVEMLPLKSCMWHF